MHMNMYRSPEAGRRRADKYEATIRDLQEKLELATEQLHRDALTGLLNRRGLARAIRAYCERLPRAGTQHVGAFIDIDDFKQINEQYGHHAGDQALQHFSTVLVGALRASDICARIGGDEFLVLLPDTPADDARELIKRIRDFRLDPREQLVMPPCPITFSAGLFVSYELMTERDLLTFADEALRRAKRNGKARTECAGRGTTKLVCVSSNLMQAYDFDAPDISNVEDGRSESLAR